MTALTVLCSTPRRPAEATAPGGALPYGMARLGERFELEWVDTSPHGARGRIRTRIGGLVRRVSPGRRGWELAHAARGRVPKAVLSVFEDAGLAFARRQSGAGAPVHVMMSCWMAQDVQDRPRDTRSLRASLASVAEVCVYSSNQPPILSDALGIAPGRIHVVPFGVDTHYYDRAHARGPAGGGGVVAVGSDSRRDYATLFAAASARRIPMTVACHPRNLVGLHVPAEVRLVSVFDAAYRDLLHRADVVVTATTAPAYPSGQSVVLEAMSMGTATITTDSPAMRDYVDDGVSGILSPAGDADALAAEVGRVLDDDALRSSLAEQGARRVRERFTLERQWDAVGAVVHGATT